MFVNFKIFYLFKTIHKKILGKKRKKFNHTISELAATLETKKPFHGRQSRSPGEGSGPGAAQHWPPGPVCAPPVVTVTRVPGQGCPASTLL